MAGALRRRPALASRRAAGPPRRRARWTVRPASPSRRSRSAAIPCGPGWPRRRGPRRPPAPRPPPARGAAWRGQLGAHHLVPAAEDQLAWWPLDGAAPGGRSDPGHGLGPRAGARGRRPGAGAGAALIGAPAARRTADDAGHARSPAGRGTAVVRMDWPAGSSATRARLRAGSSSEKTSSSSRVGLSGVPAGHQAVDPHAQGQGQAALLALGGVGAGLTAVDGQHQRRRGAGPPCSRPAGGRRAGRPPAPRPARPPSCARRPWADHRRSPAPASRA